MRLSIAFLLGALAAPLSCLPAAAQQAGPPGKFDGYLLSLSWSPTYCASRAGRADAEQCDGPRIYGFVVHGLWPQYQAGGYPAECVAQPSAVPEKVIEDTLPVMPSRRLIEHEWRRHGTCDGTEAAAFFTKTREAFASVRIPAEFIAPKQPLSLRPEQVEALFSKVNPGLTGERMAVVCRGRYAAEVRLCLDRDMKFAACGKDVRDHCADGALFPPLR